MTVPAKGRQKVGVYLNTSFTNKLTDDFIVDLPPDSYAINDSQIPQEIKNKAKEIITEQSDYPNYYKLGKFVNSYMTYDLNYKGKDLSLADIYRLKRGVCEHFTLLYNAMLNSVGINTFYLSGWAFDKNTTSADENSVGHAWTAALINGKWKELDSTWGLFEGVPAGHIMKTIGKESFSYSYRESTHDFTFKNIPSIKMTSVSDEDNVDPLPAKSSYLSSTIVSLILFYLFSF